MGNFAENLNLGNRFRPPLFVLHSLSITGDVSNSKRHQRLDKILIFLPELHRGIRKVVFKNSVMQYARETWRNPVRIAYACYNARVSYGIRFCFLANNFADF